MDESGKLVEVGVASVLGARCEATCFFAIVHLLKEAERCLLKSEMPIVRCTLTGYFFFLPVCD